MWLQQLVSTYQISDCDASSPLHLLRLLPQPQPLPLPLEFEEQSRQRNHTTSSEFFGHEAIIFVVYILIWVWLHSWGDWLIFGVARERFSGAARSYLKFRVHIAEPSKVRVRESP
ncbi:hypothetical protein K1719_032005 [Acacia pycnantha]|nr:hypothetical protein K1719_032005 [Acacia pycnantha]